MIYLLTEMQFAEVGSRLDWTSAGSHSAAWSSTAQLLKLDKAVRVDNKNEMNNVLNLNASLIFECSEAPVCKIQLLDAGFGFEDILEDTNKQTNKQKEQNLALCRRRSLLHAP